MVKNGCVLLTMVIQLSAQLLMFDNVWRWTMVGIFHIRLPTIILMSKFDNLSEFLVNPLWNHGGPWNTWQTNPFPRPRKCEAISGRAATRVGPLAQPHGSWRDLGAAQRAAGHPWSLRGGSLAEPLRAHTVRFQGGGTLELNYLRVAEAFRGRTSGCPWSMVSKSSKWGNVACCGRWRPCL